MNVISCAIKKTWNAKHAATFPYLTSRMSSSSTFLPFNSLLHFLRFFHSSRFYVVQAKSCTTESRETFCFFSIILYPRPYLRETNTLEKYKTITDGEIYREPSLPARGERRNGRKNILGSLLLSAVQFVDMHTAD